MRKYYIDNIRWITVALVVVYHVVYMFNAVVTAGVVGPFRATQPQDAIQYVLYPWFMALLFLVSGMCARYDLDRRTAGEFVRARTRKLLVPSTLGLLVFHWVQGYVSMRLSGAFETITDNVPGPVFYLIMCLSGTGVLWFLQMLWLFDLLLVLARKLERGRLASACEKLPCHPAFLLALGVPAWGAAQVLNTPVIAVYRFGIYGFVFFLGYYLFSQERVTDALAKCAPALGTAAAVLAAVSTRVYFGQNYAEPPVVNSPLSIACLWVTCLAVLGLMKRYGDRTSGFCLFMVRKSWGIYIFHYLPISACGMLLTEYTKTPPVCVYLLTLCAGFGGALALDWVISRIPVVRWCVLGIKKTAKGA